jgi:hypothetical protein
MMVTLINEGGDEPWRLPLRPSLPSSFFLGGCSALARTSREGVIDWDTFPDAPADRDSRRPRMVFYAVRALVELCW